MARHRDGSPRLSPPAAVSGIADLLRKTYSGDAWHGPSLREALAGVSAAEASARPLPGAHSIWELVLHLTFWKETVGRRLEGDPVGDVPADENWPPVGEPTAERWKGALEGLERAHRRLVSAAGRLGPGDLSRLLPGEAGRSYTVRETLYGVLQHDAYHGGQISLLGKGPARR